jgi:hypothetical protein
VSIMAVELAESQRLQERPSAAAIKGEDLLHGMAPTKEFSPHPYLVWPALERQTTRR